MERPLPPPGAPYLQVLGFFLLLYILDMPVSSPHSTSWKVFFCLFVCFLIFFLIKTTTTKKNLCVSLPCEFSCHGLELKALGTGGRDSMGIKALSSTLVWRQGAGPQEKEGSEQGWDQG